MPTPDPARRSFLARLATGTAAFTASLGLSRVATAQTAPASQTHELDAWIDELKGKHKQVYDCVTKTHIAEMSFAQNFINAQVSEYGLKEDEISSIVSMRHEATAFAFNDAMWEKYKIGEALDVPARPVGGRGGANAPPADSARAPSDSTAGAKATRNPQTRIITALGGRGVKFTVCSLALGRYSNDFARKSGTPVADVRAELIANLVPNCRTVAAGVVIVNRAQEKGFSLLYVG